MKLIAIVACFCLFGCQNEIKDQTKLSNKENFHNCIEIILLWHNGYQFELYTISKAYRSLETITGIKSKVLLTDVPYRYYQDTDLKIDLQNWLDWYSKNSEELNSMNIENRFDSIPIYEPDYNDSLYIKTLKMRYQNKPHQLDSLIKYDSINILLNKTSFPEPLNKLLSN